MEDVYPKGGVCSPDVLDENEASMGIEIFERDFKWNFVKS